MAVARANPEFYGSESLPALSSGLRRDLQSGDVQWPLRPSALFFEALEAQGMNFIPPKEGDSVTFWKAWDKQLSGKRVTFGPRIPRRMQDITPGTGMVNEAFRGSWRIAGCSDYVTTIPPLAAGFSDVNTLVSVDYPQPGVTQQGASLSPCLGSTACNPATPVTQYCPAHSDDSYASALLMKRVRVDNYLVKLVDFGDVAWMNPSGTINCSGVFPTQSQTPSATPLPSSSPGTRSSTPTQSLSGTPSPTPSMTPSPCASSSITPSSTITPQSTFIPISASSPASASPTPTLTPTISPTAASTAMPTGESLTPSPGNNQQPGNNNLKDAPPPNSSDSSSAAIGGGVGGGIMFLGLLVGGTSLLWRRSRSKAAGSATFPPLAEIPSTTVNPIRMQPR